MVLESRITWEKLCLELELISKEEPKSLIPMMIGINSILGMNDSPDWCSRAVNFMVYELNTLCENKSESERFEILNNFFFVTRDYQIKNVSRRHLLSSEMLIKTILEERAGAALPVLILYLHLAHRLDLPIFAINQPQNHVLKWVRGAKAAFIDLAENARLMTEEELLQIINRGLGRIGSPIEEPKLEVLSFKSLLAQYLHDLRRIYLNEKNNDLAHAVLSMLLKIEPTNLKYLGERALLRKQMGHHKEALQDLKRYFSFTDITQAPPEIQMASRELHALNVVSNPEMLH
jgi:regulator of sirC expression with transglutaminase-like and TPR domain